MAGPVVPVFIKVLLAVLFVGSAVAALTFWNKILDWARETLSPWIEKYLPELKRYIEDAFYLIDENVATPIRRKVKQAWKELRKFLLKILVQFELNTQNEWVKRITYWARRNLESKQVTRVVTEETVDFELLPDDVQKQLLNRGNTTQDVNVTQVRDRELELELTMPN